MDRDIEYERWKDQIDMEVDAEVVRLLEAEGIDVQGSASWPMKEKVRLMLRMQKLAYPLLAARRTLEWWERPWDIEP